VSIALVDYGAGNLTSVRKGFRAVGADLFTPTAPADLDTATGIVVPGVGHFAATAALEGAWRDAIGRAVENGTPLLGICLGMQWLFDGSDEAPGVRGLGVMRGTCRRIEPTAGGSVRLKVPHVGWNMLETLRSSRLAGSIGDGAYVYFTHAYAAPLTDDAVATTVHGGEFPAIVEAGHVFGVQFHPEKSGAAGLQALAAFAELCRAR
jgi:glutamine amidotransferase